MKRGSWAAALLGALVASRVWAAAEVPDHQVFEALLAYAEAGRFDRLEKLLPYTERTVPGPEGRSGGGEGLRAAVTRRDAKGVGTEVRRLIVLHMRELFARAGEEPARASVLLRMAFLDFRLLEPGLRGRDPASAMKAEAAFKAVYAAIKEGGDPDRPDLRAKLAEVVRICSEDIDVRD
ncbi:MAG: hypothetical protein HY928_15805 [Elusimicrobia bacterium]|nr:hypothetical protein [Elusimicrobiota bacterium]